MTALAERLAARTLELVDIPSPSGNEAAIREHLLGLVPSTVVPVYAGDEVFLLLPQRRSGAPLVVLAGHYDTVPAQANLPGRRADGAVHGLGASDMKGGVAVALELVRDLGSQSCPYDVGMLLFGREELPADRNPLPAFFAECEAVHEAALAVLLEPTDLEVQAGCLGNVVARLTFHGRSGHSARPWQADNAIERAVRGLERLLTVEPRKVVVGGLEFVEVLSVTGLEAGIAPNVIPAEATATVNLRYAPDRMPEEAEAHLRQLVGESATVEIASHAPPARPPSGSPHVQRLLAAGALALTPKQAWTNVADFAARGIDAVNYGPGSTAHAHRQDELVEVSALVRAYETLRRFLAAPIGDDPA